MPTPMNAATYVLHELQAREAWAKRDYEFALRGAKKAAAAAAGSDDADAWWNMTYLHAECLRELNALEECIEVAGYLLDHPLSTQHKQLAVRALTLLAIVLQGLDRLPEAREAAAAAVEEAAEDEQFGGLRIDAQRAYIAAFAESGDLHKAWLQCLKLDAAVSHNVDDQTCGKAYWVIGNVAFLRQDAVAGLRYHSLAARRLSPTNDVDLWAKFNKASAAMRLAAGILDPETLECIERAELAAEVVGASDSERLQLSVTRANWLYSTGNAQAATNVLRPVFEQRRLLYPQTAGEAAFLLGQALHACGESEESLANLRTAADYFTAAGAEDRAALAIAAIEEHGT